MDIFKYYKILKYGNNKYVSHVSSDQENLFDDLFVLCIF